MAQSKHSQHAVTATALNGGNGALPPIEDISQVLPALRREADHYIEQVYQPGHKQLIRILQRCYQVYEWAHPTDAAEAAGRQEQLDDMIDPVLAERGIKPQNSSTLMTKIVYYIFDVQRGLASAYSIILRKVHMANVSVDSFASYIDGAGGLEAIRLGRDGPNASATPDRKMLERSLLKRKPLAAGERGVVENPPERAQLRAALVACTSDGVAEIKWVSSRSSGVSGLLKMAGAEQTAPSANVTPLSSAGGTKAAA
ncbi:MAG TPA: hypothetical protein VHP37_28065 [Burkholderiales bacterium]|nr:hypothetical protein [Burkholderiales bacterium]